MDPITRRELLRRLGLGGAALAVGPHWLGGCGRDGEFGEDDLPFAMWRELQRGVRQSPDHLPARARRLVAARDLDGLVALVTDDIRTLPTVGRGGEAAGTSMRWGAEGALRARAGTPREKCELLALLLTEAGVPASVMMSDTTPTPEEWDGILAPRPPLPFAPDVSERQLAHWASILGVEPVSAPSIDEELDRMTGEIVARVLATEGLPTLRPVGRSLRSGPLPVVVLGAGDERRVVSPAVPGDRLRPSPTDGVLREPATPSGTYRVSARLSFVTTTAPDGPRILVENEWAAPDIIGRQIVLGTVPALPPELLGAATFSGVQALIPFIAVQGPGLDSDQVDRLARIGDPVTWSGQTIDTKGEVPIIDGIALAPAGTASLETVTSLELQVDPADFPTIHARLIPRDAEGRTVEGLQAVDFRVIDEGTDVPALLTANRPSPSVVLMIDQSLSMPSAFRGDAGVALTERLQAGVLARFPAARIDYRETNSDLWRWLGWARARSPDLTVFITDGDLGDRLTDDLREALSTSGPTLLLNVRPGREVRFGELAAVTGARVASVTEAGAALARIMETLDGAGVAPYRLQYGAVGPDPDLRSVRVVTGDGRVEATAHYRVPTGVADGEGICGVHLTLEVTRDGARSVLVERTLGGFDGRFQAPSQEHVAAATEALRGSCMIHVEGGGTSPSIRLDDFLEGQLGLEPFVRAIREGRDLAPLALAADTTIPPEVLALTAGLEDPSGEALVHEEGLRMVMHRLAFRMGTDRLERSVDILPTLQAVGTHRDARVAFDATLRATARLAATEAAAFPISTVSLAGGSPLRRVPTASALSVELDRPDRIWWDRLIRGHGRPVLALVPDPPTRGRKALWELNPATGELRGVLDDGSGGGSAEESIRRQLEEYDQVMAYYGLLFEAIGVGNVVGGIGGFSLGVVSAYNQALVRLYAAVSLVIINMDASGLDAAIRDSLRQFACNVAREAFLGALGGAGRTSAQAVSLFNSTTNLLTILYPGSALGEAVSC